MVGCTKSTKNINKYSKCYGRIHLMVGCTKSTKNINKYSKCYGSSLCSSQTHDRYYSCSCISSLRPQRRRRGQRRQRRRGRGRLQRRGRRGGQLRRRLRPRGGG